MTGHIEPLTAILRIGGKYGEPYTWSATLRYLRPDEVEILGAVNSPSWEEGRAIKEVLKTNGIRKYSFCRIKPRKTYFPELVMKKVILLVVILLSSIGVGAQNNTTRFFIAYDHQELTVDATAGGVAFSTAKITASDGPANAVTFTVTCSSGTDCPIRITMDGTTVTASVGLRLTSGQSATVYSRTNITNFRAIREGATSAVLDTIFFR